MPSGPAEYQSGTLTLQNGATLRVSGSPKSYMVSQMKARDTVVACYGKPQTWADAPLSRATTVLELTSNSFYGALIGEWPKSALAR